MTFKEYFDEFENFGIDEEDNTGKTVVVIIVVRGK